MVDLAAMLYAELRVDSAKVKSDVEKGIAGVNATKAGESTGATFGEGFKAKAGAAFQSAVGSLAKVGVASFAAIGVASVKMAGDFQAGMTTLVTGAGESEKNLAMVSDGVKSLAVASGTSTKQLTDGLFMIESAGFHGAAGLDVLKAAAQGAKIGNADLGVVSNALTTVMKDYGPAVGTATQATDGLMAIVSNGKVHLEDLSGSLARVLPTAAALKIPFGDVGGAMATMTGEGTSARLAAMGLNATLLALSAPTAGAAATMKTLGISSQEVSDTLTHKGLVAALTLVHDAALKAGPEGSAPFVTAMKSMLGGANGLRTGLELTGTHMKDLVKNTKAVGDATHDAGKNVVGWESVQKDFNQQLDVLKARLEVAAITIGEKLIPVTSKVIGFLTQTHVLMPLVTGVVGLLTAAIVTQGIMWFTLEGKAGNTMIRMGAAIITWAATQAASLITTAALWVMYTLGVESAGLATVIATGGIILIVAALVVGAYELYKHWDTVWKFVKSAAEAAFNWLKQNWPLVLAILLGPFAVAALEIAKHWGTITRGAAGALDAVKGVWSGFATWVSHVFDSAVSFLKGVWNGIAGPVIALFNTIKTFVTSSFDTWWKSNGDAIKEIWRAIWAVMLAVFHTLWDPIVAAVRLGWTILQVAFQVGTTVVRAVWGALWGALVSTFHTFWDPLVVLLRAGWTVIQALFTAGMTVVRAAWQAGWTLIQAVTSAAWAVIQTLFHTGIAVLQAAWTLFWSVLGNVLKMAWLTLQTIIKVAWDIIVGIFTVAIQLLTGHWSAAWAALQLMCTQVWNAIKAFFVGWWAATQAIFSAALTFVQTLLSNAWKVITSVAEAAWNILKAFFTAWWTTLKAEWSAALTFVETLLSGAWNSVKNTAVAVWNAIWAFFVSWWNTLKANWTALITWVETALSAAWNSIKQVAAQVWDAIKAYFDTWWSNLKANFSAAVNWLKSTLSTAWSDIQSGAKTAWDAIVQAIKTALTAIGNAVRAPIEWVIETPLNGGIIKGFNWISGKVGGPNIPDIPHIPSVPAFREGVIGAFEAGTVGVGTGVRRIPGYGGGDKHLALLEAGESVVPKELTPHMAGWLKAHGVPGHQFGWIGDIAGFASSVWDKVVDSAKISAALMTGNATALTNAFTDLVGGKGNSGAVAEMATLLTDVPKTLIKSVVAWIVTHIIGQTAGGGDIVADAKSWIGKIPYVWGGTTLGAGGADCCIIGSMHIQTPCGPKQIRDVVPGDEVYSWDDGKLRLSRITRLSAPRFQMTYRLRTNHREIIASGNHPFLVIRKTGKPLRSKPSDRECSAEGCTEPGYARTVCQGHYMAFWRAGQLDALPAPSRPDGSAKGYETAWTELDQLRRGDVVVALQSLPDENPAPDDEYLSDPEFLWLLGFALGDGHLRKGRRNGISLAAFGDSREIVQRRLTGYCGKPGTPEPSHGLRLHDARLAEGLRRYGLERRSTDRIVPADIWTLPHGHIRAFLDGYTTADGHTSKRAGDPCLAYKAASRELVDGVRNLHLILGHNVTRVKEIRRTRPIIIKGTEIRNAQSLWCFEAYSGGYKLAHNGADLLRHAGIAELFPEDSHFIPQRVLTIEPLTEDDTYDITVDDTHNFVAEGLVVHNSGFSQAIYARHGINAPRTSEAQGAWVKRGTPTAGGLAFYHSAGGGPDPGHVAIVADGQNVVSQGGGMGPQMMGLHGMPLLWTGIPPGGLPKAALGAGAGAAGSAAAGSVKALAQQQAAALGWTGVLWNDINALEMAEAGWSLTATNPSSGAYGIAQFINGASEYAQYGGNSGSAAGQITGFYNYIAQRYGSPAAAWAHEQAYHWYGDGGPIYEPVTGVGHLTGDVYQFGEHGPETVTPGLGGGDHAAIEQLSHRLDKIASLLGHLIETTAAVPAGVGAHVGGALGDTAAAASFRGRYPQSGW